MENLEKKLFSALILLFISISLFAQSNVTQPQIRVRLWSMLESNPGLELPVDPDEEFYTYAVRMLKKTAPYIFNGMIFGYEFEYTPYDKTRKVNEFFSATPLFSDSKEAQNIKNNIKFTDPKIEENIIYCYAEYNLDHLSYERLKRKESVTLIKIKGKGYGKLIDEEKGIQQAFDNAIKEAVRNYARTITKNKPKEITGKVIINKEPRIYIQHGQYCADLEFLIEEIEIQDYSVF